MLFTEILVWSVDCQFWQYKECYCTSMHKYGTPNCNYFSDMGLNTKSDSLNGKRKFHEDLRIRPMNHRHDSMICGYICFYILVCIGWSIMSLWHMEDILFIITHGHASGDYYLMKRLCGFIKQLNKTVTSSQWISHENWRFSKVFTTI